jgi:hypothetical protein
MMNLPEIATRLRRGSAALALAGTLTLCAACGGGGGTEESGTTDSGTPPAVSGEVQVTEEEMAQQPETPEATPTPERRAPEVRAVGRVRDPFINPLQASVVPVEPQASAPAMAAGGASAAGPTSAGSFAALKKPKAPVMPTPDVTVTGLVRSGSGYRAILTGPDGSLIVATGQKVGPFQIGSISPKGVVLTWKGQKVTLPLEREQFGPDGLPRQAESRRP